MDLAALVVAALALLVALRARSRIAALASKTGDDQAIVRSRLKGLVEEGREGTQALREMLAHVAVAARSDLTPEMIREGRLWRDVTAADAVAMLAKGGVRVVDVRTPIETARGVIPGALLIPIDDLEERAGEIPRDQQPTLVYCAGGGRSSAACEMLSRRGWAGMHNLLGGFGSWTGPVERPR